jgi:hypothetical protein
MRGNLEHEGLLVMIDVLRYVMLGLAPSSPLSCIENSDWYVA